VVAVLATLDTKNAEALFLDEWFRRHGFESRLVDVTTRPEPGRRRDETMAAMGERAGAILRQWHEEGILAGAMALGGNQGTAIAGIAMRALPVGVPKVIVSTIASGNIRPYIGSSDIAVISSIGDLLGGPNSVTRDALIRAAGMLVGMIEAVAEPPAHARAATASTGAVPAAPGGVPAGGPAVALTALGNTEPAATRALELLRGRGYEVVPFHASGAGGSAMESLVTAGRFRGVLDLTTHELLGELFGDDTYAPVQPGRLTAAGRAGLPQVVAPGGLDYFVFGPEASIPTAYRGRAIHYHNPYNTNVRVTASELRRVGAILAQRLNAARGPTAFLYPVSGWSSIGSQGSPLWDPQANEALREVLRHELRAGVRYIEVGADINAPIFADRMVEVFLDLAQAPVGPP
jgi:uncharacterized protein (UPF0261 family)